jgi:tetratricopeptide (TPR) repeat protein
MGGRTGLPIDRGAMVKGDVEPRDTRRFPDWSTFVLAMALLPAVSMPFVSAAPKTPVVSTLPATADAFVRSGLKDLHDGLYAKAEESFQQAARAAPGDPAPDLFIAFTFWWRMIQDRSDRTLDDAFLRAAGHVIENGQNRLEAAPGDVRLLSCVGTAHILSSQVEGLRRNFLKAAQEARRGKKMLEDALEIDPSQPDTLFGLGAYNYYTEKVPGLARGLLFMPRGNAELGLRQLKTTASSNAYFNTDARLLLALICGSKDEQCYDDALRHLNLALAEDPASPLLLASIGGVKMKLGYYAEAIRAFEKALASASGASSERRAQRRTLQLYLAEALTADWRLGRASEALKGVGDLATLPARERQLSERVAVEIAQKGGEQEIAPASVAEDRPDPAILAAKRVSAPGPAGRVHEALLLLERGKDPEALALLGAAAADRPGDPLPRFLMGKIHFERGRFTEAARELDAALERAPNPPAWMAGWIEIYDGLVERARGHRDVAHAHFRSASEVRRFRSAERGFLELQEGVPPHGRCRP